MSSVDSDTFNSSLPNGSNYRTFSQLASLLNRQLVLLAISNCERWDATSYWKGRLWIQTSSTAANFLVEGSYLDNVRTVLIWHYKNETSVYTNLDFTTYWSHALLPSITSCKLQLYFQTLCITKYQEFLQSLSMASTSLCFKCRVFTFIEKELSRSARIMFCKNSDVE